MLTLHNSLDKFVTDKFGEDILILLNNISKGGSNNFKGRNYENFFQLSKAFELASSENIDLTKHSLSCQERAFIDDICHIDDENSIKYNFQAKNSSGQAANWTNVLSKRCKLQTEIDNNYHSIKNSKNYLVVPCKKKQQSNLDKIPSSLKNNNSCIFFPAYESLFELIQNTELKSHIIKLISSNSASDIDYAAKLILGSLQDFSVKQKTVYDIFQSAQSDAYPNPFKKFQLATNTPAWINKLLETTSNQATYSIQCSRGSISFNGFVATASLDAIYNVTESRINQLHNIQDLMRLFLELATSELLNSSPSGEA